MNLGHYSVYIRCGLVWQFLKYMLIFSFLSFLFHSHIASFWSFWSLGLFSLNAVCSWMWLNLLFSTLQLALKHRVPCDLVSKYIPLPWHTQAGALQSKTSLQHSCTLPYTISYLGGAVLFTWSNKELPVRGFRNLNYIWKPEANHLTSLYVSIHI